MPARLSTGLSTRLSLRLATLLGVLVGGLLAISYSWTFTPLGRLDYRAAVIAKLASLGDDEPMALTPEARAEADERTRAMLSTIPSRPGVAIEEHTVPADDGATIPVRVYHPDASRTPPFYLDIHGGGWWMGGGFLFEPEAIDLAARSGAIVVSVDYRLAPEHPHPTPLDDCWSVLRWIAREGASLGGDPTRIAVGGSSAGGNLAAALALRARHEGGPPIAFQVLQVPATDLSGTREWHSYDQAGEGYVLTVDGIEQMIEAYVPEPARRMHPFVSPLLEGDLSGLPPALVVTALFDPLRDQGEAYARRLEAAGVPVRLHREEGALHGFIGSPERARRIRAMVAEALREALAG